MKRRYALAALSIYFLVAAAAQAGEIWKLPLEENSKLLGNKLVVKMPKGAKIEARGHSIMAAPEADENETRVVVESDGAKVVLMAYDLHATEGSDFSQSVDRFLKDELGGAQPNLKRSSGVSKSDGGLNFVRVESTSGDKQQGEALMIASAIVANKDKTVQQLNLYVNPTGAKDWSELSKLAGTIFQSIAAGPNQAHLEQHIVEVDPQTKLSIALPESTVTAMQSGPDFNVFQCFKLVPLGNATPTLFIYRGHHPNFKGDPKNKLLTGKIFGKTVDWYTRDRDHGIAVDTLVKVPGHSDFLHIMASAEDETKLKEMLQIAETLNGNSQVAPAK